MYVSVIVSMVGLLFYKQTTILAEAIVIIVAFLLPLAIIYANTKLEQIKKICYVLGLIEAGLVFALIVGNRLW
ncbi:hypothetical protein COV88_00885 [Candidatus Saccharibacteria bacterium CG11_big_fil_rev_8_21_14_0_20_41_19]|nr:MAG: hypothetical protein AUK57_00360 [Candidatus Saccharibacteria bacterium CG2_30_41_52]PIQ71027.1 MAG: hypothetical protein COV88_00885 [Candidatus Saccharibacteria bacterium CG11_big_fil_rev_8_21_14_0_20_41_19]PIZ59438.1 MAG: hypothetical protein COY18_03565 [Candidatus Saccharibacteria bacterium CG_4_10_14_0_2_um_filter_41_11]